MDRSDIRLSQYLTGILQACLLVFTMVGYLHQLLQVVASALAWEILMEESDSSEEPLFGQLIILTL